MAIHQHRISNISVLFVILLLIIGPVTTVTAQAITVEGNFSGTLAGYPANQDEKPNKIRANGQLTFKGEDAQKVTIEIKPGPYTVLDRSAIEIFVEGNRDISFDRQGTPNSVVFSTESIPSGTTVQIEYQAVYLGGADADTINAGTVVVNYETPGGTPGEESFETTTDITNSADHQIADLESTISELEGLRLLGVGGLGVGVLMLIVAAILYRKLKSCREELTPGPGSGGGPGPKPPN